MSADKHQSPSKAEVFAGWLDGRVHLHQHDRDEIAAELRRTPALEAERDAFKAQCYEEMDANHALRKLGAALPDEDMGTFLRRVIAERDQLRAEVEALRADAERWRWFIAGLGNMGQKMIDSTDAALKADDARKAAP